MHGETVKLIDALECYNSLSNVLHNGHLRFLSQGKVVGTQTWQFTPCNTDVKRK